MGQVRIPLFKKADLDATIGVFFDGFSKVIVALSVLVGTFGLDASTVFGTMMPGLLVTVIVLNGGMWVYYRHVAKQRGDANLTAIPAGLQAGRMFIWLFSIMLPVYQATGDAMLAFKVGVLAHFFSGLVFLIGAFVVPLLLKIVPAGALFGSLGGGAMAFLILQSMNGALAMPLVGWLSLVVLFVIYLGKVETKLPAVLIAIVVGAGVAWISGAMSVDTVTGSLANIGFYVPLPTFWIFAPEVFEQVVNFTPSSSCSRSTRSSPASRASSRPRSAVTPTSPPPSRSSSPASRAWWARSLATRSPRASTGATPAGRRWAPAPATTSASS